MEYLCIWIDIGKLKYGSLERKGVLGFYPDGKM